MARYGSDQAYNREVIADFGREEGVELLIVVDKLLVGFDEPRNTVLYLTRILREHTLLQAICRTNRPYPGKSHGLIVDYIGVFDDVARALYCDE